MKKILVLNIGTSIGGIESSLINFLEYISGKDCKIDLVLWREKGPLYDMIPPSVNIIDGLSPKSFKSVIRTPGIIKKCRNLLWYTELRLLKLLKKPLLCMKRLPGHYDVAVSYCQNGYSPYYVIDKVSADKKYMWYHHGSYEKKGIDYKIDKQYYPKFQKIIAVSYPCKEMLCRKFPELHNKIEVINNIINIPNILKKSQEEVYDIKKEEGKFMFVTVSRFSYEKGIDIAVKTAFELKKAGCKFVWYFIGDGDYMKNIKSMVKEMQLGDCCILLGERTNPLPYIRLADIYIQTSRVEAHPITIAEAMVLNKVIVATNLSSIKRMMNNGFLGRLCPLNEVHFKNAIIKLLESKEQRKQYVERLKKTPITNESTYKGIDALISL